MYVTLPSGPVSAVVDHWISLSSPSRVRQWNSARTGDSPARSARMPASAHVPLVGRHQVEQRVRRLELGRAVAEQLLAGAVPPDEPAAGRPRRRSARRPRRAPHREARCARRRGSYGALRGPPRNPYCPIHPDRMPVRQTFLRMDLKLLDDRLATTEEPPFRAHQVWEWAARGATSYDEMTNLPLELRERLAGEVPFSSLRLVDEALASDGTEKALFHTHDGRPVEAVLMRYRDGRRSLCVSSQSGCPLTCTFCATGTMRFGRNLTASEILDQALHFRRKERREPRRLHGHGRAAHEPRQRAGRLRALPGHGDRALQHRRVHGRLDPGHRPDGRGGAAGAAGAVAARGRRGAPLRAHARERPLPARPTCSPPACDGTSGAGARCSSST